MANRQKNIWEQEAGAAFEQGLDMTVDWNLNNKDWIERIQSGDYLKWVEKNYSAR